jgi:7-keto-8-aminopelargonate synthetase-like enzyme
MRYVHLMARPFLFSASPLPAAVAAAMRSLDIVQAEPERRERLRANATRMRDGIRQLGFHTTHSETPIIPVIIGEEMVMAAFWKDLLENGLYANAVTAPAVPPDASMVRISCTAVHTTAQVDEALDILGRVGRAHGLI